MLSIMNNRITLTRGDDAQLVINITDSAGAVRNMFTDDLLTMTVRDKINGTLLFSITTNTNTLTILPTHTSNIEFGSYIYDVQLRTFDGKTYTVITPSSFILDKEVTY